MSWRGREGEAGGGAEHNLNHEPRDDAEEAAPGEEVLPPPDRAFSWRRRGSMTGAARDYLANELLKTSGAEGGPLRMDADSEGF